MNIRFINNNGQVVVALYGKLDTSETAAVNQQIAAKLESCETISSLTCDVAELSYISSSGLRLLLSMARRCQQFAVVNAQQQVYHVMEVTGFTKIMHVERALREMSVDGCEEIGRGGVGVVYRIDDDTIIKVFREGSTIDELRSEIALSKEAFVLGMPTAISFDVVRVGKRYGLVYEFLDATTLSAMLRQHPERIDEAADRYARLFHQLHAIEVPATSQIPNAKEQMERSVRHLSRYFSTEAVDTLLRMVSLIPDERRLLHCDLQTKNAMLQGEELMLIDMGELGYGHPVIDLANSYSSMVSLLGDYEAIIGLPQSTAREVWQRMIVNYFRGIPNDLLVHRLEQIDAISRIRNFSWLALSDNFPSSLIKLCQDAFHKRVTAQQERLLSICRTLSDWTL